MKIAIYGKYISKEFYPYFNELIEKLQNENVDIFIFKPLYDCFKNEGNLKIKKYNLFESTVSAPEDIDFFICIGGDGTYLESMCYLKSSEIPVIGINTGRLGYLTNTGADEISLTLDAIFRKDYKIEERALLRIESGFKLLEGFNFGLNEVSVQKMDSSLISIDTWINEEFVNTYWTDGLIIATPTGSTAYSLSVGGPIVVPGSKNFIIAPIASHNLSVRPIVIPDDVKIKLKVNSRSGKFIVTADNRTQVLDMQHNVLFVRKTKFILKMIKLPFNNYYSTLRNKLMWGADKRN